MPRATARAATAVLAVLALAACTSAGSTETAVPATIPALAPPVPLTELDTLLTEPRSFVGESTATLWSGAIEPVVANPAQSLPVEVVSRDLGGDVAVEVADTSRIVAVDIAGSIAATVWGLGFGDSLIGRDVSTTFEGAEHLPVVTSNGHTVSAEAILALEPTLVITDGSVGPVDVLEQLRQSGIALVFVDNESSFDGATALARQVSEALGVPEAGELLAERIQAEVAAKIAEIAEISPQHPDEKLRMMFLYIRGNSGIYYIFGEDSGSDDLIDSLGGIDVAREVGWAGSRPMTDEAMVTANPDLILVMTKGLESAGGVDGLLDEKPAIALTAAGQNRRFVDMADGDLFSFGPRSARVLDALARAVYAP